MARTHTGAVREDLYPTGGTACWSSRKVRRKEKHEGNCFRLTPAPIPHIPALLGAEGGRSVDTEEEQLSLGRSWGGLSVFVFVSHHATLFLIGK